MRSGVKEDISDVEVKAVDEEMRSSLERGSDDSHGQGVAWKYVYQGS